MSAQEWQPTTRKSTPPSKAIARQYYDLGMNILPIKKGTKSPAVLSWEHWQSSRQAWEAIAHFDWRYGVGAINGIGNWHSIDIDHAPSYRIIAHLLELLTLPVDYPWITRTGNGYHLWFQAEGTLTLRDSTKGVYIGLPKSDYQELFERIELRWERCYTILPPTPHPHGLTYEWARGWPERETIGTLTTSRVQDAFLTLATLQEGRKEEPPPVELPSSPPIPISSSRARKAFTLELRQLRGTTQGSRNDQLNKSAFALGQLVGSGSLDEEEVTRELTEVALAIGLEEREVTATIRSGLNSGKKTPRTPKQAHDALTPTQSKPKTEKPPTSEELVAFSADDAGNGDTMYLLHGSEFLYCSAYGWLFWNDRYWEHDENESHIGGAIVDTLRKRRVAAVTLQDEQVIKCTKADRSRLAGCKETFRILVSERSAAFDSDPDLLNVANGVLDLRTGELTPHSPEQRFTYCVPVPYEEQADYSPWTAYLSTVIGEGEGMLDYIQAAAGYSLTGHTSEECIFYLYGPTRGGKGTFAEGFLELLPRPLATSVDFNTFTARRDEDTSNFHLAPLKPARLVIASESNKYQSLNPAKIKQLTGGDHISCSFKHRDVFTYRPQYKVWLMSNHKVNADPDDDGMWGRIRVIEFPNSFLGREDRSIKARMKSRRMLTAVLAWAVEGARRWYKLQPAGLVAPVTVTNSTDGQRKELDYVGQWLEECCEEDQQAWTENDRLYGSYATWCATNGLEPRKRKGLTMALQQKGFQVSLPRKIEGKTHRGFAGLRILSQE